jgi:hypothetical protein
LDALTHTVIIAEISRAWRESNTQNAAGRREEGGYILQNPDSSYGVARWPRGEKSRIFPPPLDANNCYNGKVVVAAFHTHPNPPVDEAGQEWEQGPSESDRRWHIQRQLRGIVVGWMFVYELDVDGTISVLGKREEVLAP